MCILSSQFLQKRLSAIFNSYKMLFCLPFLLPIPIVSFATPLFRPDVYGSSITIVRIVTSGGSSSYQLLNDAGKEVKLFSGGCSTPREEVLAMLQHFMIQVDNPLVLLPQDLAKSFLASCDERQLYTFFEKATQLDKCRDYIVEAQNEKQTAEVMLGDKKHQLPELEKNVNEWEEKRQASKK